MRVTVYGTDEKTVIGWVSSEEPGEPREEACRPGLEVGLRFHAAPARRR